MIQEFLKQNNYTTYPIEEKDSKNRITFYKQGPGKNDYSYTYEYLEDGSYIYKNNRGCNVKERTDKIGRLIESTDLYTNETIRYEYTEEGYKKTYKDNGYFSEELGTVKHKTTGLHEVFPDGLEIWWEFYWGYATMISSTKKLVKLKDGTMKLYTSSDDESFREVPLKKTDS